MRQFCNQDQQRNARQMTQYPRQAKSLKLSRENDGLVVKDTRRDRIHYLNHTAGMVLVLCDGKKSVKEIASLLQSQFGKKETAESEVTDIIEQFAAEKLVKFKKKK